MTLDRGLATVRCRRCCTILVSRHAHDRRSCGCPQQTHVDGGPAYLRFGGNDPAQVDVLVDRRWPPAVPLELLQEAVRLSRELGGWFEPLGEDPEPAVATGVPRTSDEYDARCRAIVARHPWAGIQIFGCPAGWLDLVETGLAQAERRVHAEDLYRLHLRRLDRWRGAVRLDVNDDGAAAVLWLVERKSTEVCSACGERGTARVERPGWPVLCDTCARLDDDQVAARQFPF